MANIDILRNKVKIHIRDIYTTDEEVDAIILQVIEDIAREVKLFKKFSGFTIQADKQLYDFRNIHRMNEEVEEELQDVYIGGVPDLHLIEFLNNPEALPDPIVYKRTFIEQEFMTNFGVMGFFDPEGKSISEQFKFTGTCMYMATNTDWLEAHDGEQMVSLIYGLPKIDELLEEELAIITTCVIEGCKYYFANTLQSASDAQISNLFYQRYWYKKKELIDMYPQYTYYHTGYRKDARWL